MASPMLRDTALGTLVLTASLLGCGGEPAPPKSASDAPIPLSVEPAREAAWAAGLEVSATIAPSRRALPGTLLPGRIVEVLHDAGDMVRAGALLARVASGEVDARLAQAEAGVAAARAAEQNAWTMRQRLERLAAREAASASSVEAAVAAHEGARAQRVAAEQAVEAARTWVAYAEIRAPFTGVVVERRIEAGDMAAPGTPLFVIEDLARVKVEAQLAESRAAALLPGQVVEVEVPSAGAAPWAGTIDAVLPAADPGSRTFTVRVLLDNAERRLRSGMFARVRFLGGSEPVTTVPETAVVRRGPLAFVFVVAGDGVARIRWITLGSTRQHAVVVASGLTPGESIVVDPPADLADGTRVGAR